MGQIIEIFPGNGDDTFFENIHMHTRLSDGGRII